MADAAWERLLREPVSWKYRGEGGATLVLSHPQEKLVLRLRKHCTQSPGVRAEFSDNKQICVHNLEFYENVFRPLMGPQYVQECKVVDLPEGFVAKINHNCRALRPTHRLGMEANENCRVGVVMPDFCLLSHPDDVPSVSPPEKVKQPTFCVEIKPKCGFIPTSRWITAEHAARHNVCHYCMLQKLKVKEGKYQRQSRYCPVDFFSGVEGRAMYALECLVADPQNNWRVFSDGSIIYSEETCQEAVRSKGICCYEMLFEQSLSHLVTLAESMKVPVAHTCGTIGPTGKKFLQIVFQILVADSRESEEGKASCKARADATQICQRSKLGTTEKNNTFESVNSSFGRRGVLLQLLSIQKLDDLDIEGVLPLYRQTKKHFDNSPFLATELGADGPFTGPLWKDIVSKHQNKDTRCPYDTASNCMDILSNDSLHERNHLKTAVQKICEFMIASTAKDCSIMITFQKSSQKHLPFIKDISGVSYHYNINLVDLDPKGFDRVMKYHKDMCKAVQTYIQ